MRSRMCASGRPGRLLILSGASRNWQMLMLYTTTWLSKPWSCDAGEGPASIVPRSSKTLPKRGIVWAKGYCVDTVGLDHEMIRKYVKWQEKEEQKQEELRFGE